MRRLPLLLAAALAAASALLVPAAADAKGRFKLLCNVVEQRQGEAAITYAVPHEKPKACTIHPEGLPARQALRFKDAAWTGWGTGRAKAQAIVGGDAATVVLSKLRSRCGYVVYSRIRVKGVTRTFRPDTCALPRTQRFCGYRDFETGGWSMRATDGAFQRLFAKDLGCRAARRAFERVEYLQTPPYAVVLDGWTCTRLVDAYEYSDTRCRRNGTTKSIRFQAGS